MKPKHLPSSCAFLALLTLAAASRADVKPNSLFSDGMVLQQGMEVPVWGTADDGEAVTVEFGGQKVATTAAAGGKWVVRLKPLAASAEPAVMVVTGENKVTIQNVLVGEVWLCSGQSNMERQLGPRPPQKPIDDWQKEVAAANHPTLRQFGVPRLAADAPPADVNGAWTVCSPQTAAQFGAVGYFFARDLAESRNVPVGLLFSAWGGTTAEAWTSHPALEAQPELKPLADAFDKATREFPAKLAAYRQAEPAALEKWQADAEQAKKDGKPAPQKPAPPEDPAKSSRSASTLYNGMIAPLQPFAIRGAIWYQGESNSGRGRQYRTLFPAMIADWRKAWGEGDFPFLFVQIAPYGGRNRPENDPEVREAQFLTLKKAPNTAMVVTTDIGDAADIHPSHKQPVGARLALAARALAYGEKVEYSGPLYEAMKVDGAKTVLSFTHVGGGLVAKDGELKGFTVAGADGQFVPARAEIRGDEVVVWNEQVTQPAAVRYGWAKAPDVNLFNKAGLPASPFRSDAEIPATAPAPAK